MSIETSLTEKKLDQTFILDNGTLIFIRLPLVLDAINDKKLEQQAEAFPVKILNATMTSYK